MQVRKFLSRLFKALFGTRKRMLLTFVLGTLSIGILILIGIYWYVTTGGMIARQEPPAVEKFVAGWLVDISIPAQAKAMANPLAANVGGADTVAGRELYRKSCESCHGYDGGGGTEAGSGLYPPPANLKGPVTAKRTDGALFYLIRNGIRNTGMPGWQLTDQQTWQLVSYIRHLPIVASLHPAQAPAGAGATAQYVGSASCSKCHADIYEPVARKL